MTFLNRVKCTSIRKRGGSTLAGLVFAAALAGAALAQQPSASHLVLARQVVLSSGISHLFEALVPRMMQQIAQALTRTRPEMAADLAIVLKQLEPEFQARQTEMIDQAARIFASQMTEEELKQTAAFLDTPPGKKYISVQPTVLKDLTIIMKDWSQNLATVMMTRVRVEMKKKGHEL